MNGVIMGYISLLRKTEEKCIYNGPPSMSFECTKLQLRNGAATYKIKDDLN